MAVLISSLQVFMVSTSAFDIAGVVHFRDVCLVDSIRALGIKVPYVSDGPFWAIADGNDMLRPHRTFPNKASKRMITTYRHIAKKIMYTMC